MTEDFTTEEKKLILQALDLLFQSGAIRGNLAQMEKYVNLAKSIESKFQVVEVSNIE